MTDTILYTKDLEPILASNLLVTPTAGVQGTLADALSTATGGAVSATTLTASSTVTLSPASKNVVVSPSGSGIVTIAPATAGTMDNVAIGGTTPLTGKFTIVTATDTVTLSPANKNVVISPSGSGVVTVHPATAGTIDNVAIGVSTPLAGHFTTLSASAATTITSAAPAAANSTGVAGTVTWESGFLYVCVATNTWQRVAIATFP